MKFFFNFFQPFFWILALKYSLSAEKFAEKTIKYAEQFNIDLTNKNSRFFNDICQYFYDENDKEISIFYRRRYYFFVRRGNEYVNLDQNKYKNSVDYNNYFGEPIRERHISCVDKSFKYEVFKENGLCLLSFILCCLFSTLLFSLLLISGISRIQLINGSGDLKRIKIEEILSTPQAVQTSTNSFFVPSRNRNSNMLATQVTEGALTPNDLIESLGEIKGKRGESKILGEEKGKNPPCPPKKNTVDNDVVNEEANESDKDDYENDNNKNEENDDYNCEDNNGDCEYDDNNNLNNINNNIGGINNMDNNLSVGEIDNVTSEKDLFSFNIKIPEKNIKGMKNMNINNELNKSKENNSCNKDTFTFSGISFKDNQININVQELTSEEPPKSGTFQAHIIPPMDQVNYPCTNVQSKVHTTSEQSLSSLIYNKINKKLMKKPLSKDYFEYKEDELFYQGYTLAKLCDKRSFLQMYIDFLRGCQIVFRLFDKRGIHEFLIMKIMSYFMKGLVMLTSITYFFSERNIDLIYDGEFSITNQLLFIIKCVICTNFITFFTFILTQSKREFIRQKNAVRNMRLEEGYLKKNIISLSSSQIIDNLKKKIIIFIILFYITLYYSFKFFNNFSYVYYNSKSFLLKDYLTAILLDQIFPFIFALIPTMLRNNALKQQNRSIYKYSQILQMFFIPI